MNDSVNMSVSQCFQVERMNRAIDATVDPAQLQMIAKQLLHAWQSQRAATDWVIRQNKNL
ncbi:MAG: hypothetical protein VXZ59_07725 [Cyanobacteriota bacterium]|jgi:hypothetical protein|nr:hypothetical protein [Cyanobacteriota bacterium]